MSGWDKNVCKMGVMMKRGCLLKLCPDGAGIFSGNNGVKNSNNPIVLPFRIRGILFILEYFGGNICFRGNMDSIFRK
jgi:hypothetical protein